MRMLVTLGSHGRVCPDSILTRTHKARTRRLSPTPVGVRTAVD
jgi:hypothetical protein